MSVTSVAKPKKKQKPRLPWLEVFPETEGAHYKDTDGETQHYVRLRSGNGAKLMTSEGYDTHSNAVRAARAINSTVAGDRLTIRVLDEKGVVRRYIEPKTVGLSVTEVVDRLGEADGRP